MKPLGRGTVPSLASTAAHSTARPARYGSRQPLSQRWAWLFGLLFGLMVAWLVITLMGRYGSADVSVQLRGYRVVDAGSVTATLRVSRDPERDAACLLTARGPSRAEVGHAVLRLPAQPGGPADVDVTQAIPTNSRAVMAEAKRCVALSPGAPLPFDSSIDHS